MEKRKILYYGIGTGAAILLFLMVRKSGAASGGTVPVQLGGADLGTVDYGDFESTVNVSVNPNIYKGLSQNFIPLFGFVGVGVSGAAPISQQLNVNVQTATLQAPTQIAEDVFINSFSVSPRMLDEVTIPAYDIKKYGFSNGTLREAMLDIYGRKGYVLADNTTMVKYGF